MEEVKRLKNLKREEIRKKVDLISKIGLISGTEAAKISLSLSLSLQRLTIGRCSLSLSLSLDEEYQELEDSLSLSLQSSRRRLEDELKVSLSLPEDVNAKQNEQFEKISQKHGESRRKVTSREGFVGRR